MFPKEENILKVLKGGNGTNVAYINKLGEIYAMGYGFNYLYSNSPDFIGSWIKLN